MSISDRLDEIQDRYEEWHQDRGRHTPAPDTTLWRLADYPDESMDHCIVRNDVPEMLAALRDVLDLHPKGTARAVAGTAGQDIEHCLGCRGAHGIAHDEHGLVPWPCATYRAIANALGEES